MGGIDLQVKRHSALGGYSGDAVKPIALRFISELGMNPALKGKHISGMGGIETFRDAIEFLLLGAGSLQITTAVMQYGYRIIEDFLEFSIQRRLFLPDKVFLVASGCTLIKNLCPLGDIVRRTEVFFYNY